MDTYTNYTVDMLLACARATGLRFPRDGSMVLVFKFWSLCCCTQYCTEVDVVQDWRDTQLGHDLSALARRKEGLVVVVAGFESTVREGRF